MSKNSASRRSFQQVHRDSKLAGSIEARFWKPLDRSQHERAIEAARRYESAHKRKGRRNGPIGHVGLEVLRALWAVVDYRTGRLEPSLQWLMATTGRCRDAVVTAIKRLERVGLVRHIRRFEHTGERGFRGPQVKQVTNAYALDLPEEIAALVPERRTVRDKSMAEIIDDLRLVIAQQPWIVEMGRLKLTRADLAATRPYRQDRYRNPDDPRGDSKALKVLRFALTERESASPVQARPRIY